MGPRLTQDFKSTMSGSQILVPFSAEIIFGHPGLLESRSFELRRSPPLTLCVLRNCVIPVMLTYSSRSVQLSLSGDGILERRKPSLIRCECPNSWPSVNASLCGES